MGWSLGLWGLSGAACSAGLLLVDLVCGVMGGLGLGEWRVTNGVIFGPVEAVGCCLLGGVRVGCCWLVLFAGWRAV